MREIVRILIFLIALTCLLSVKLQAKESPFFFSHLGVEDGLSQITVLKIYQHSDGFIWMGTRNGLNRYDGYNFRVFRHEVNNPASLSDNYITDIKEDKCKNLWVGTTNGLNHINHLTGKVTRFYPRNLVPEITNKIISVLPSSDGRVVVFASRAIFICNPETLQMEVVSAAIEWGSVITTAATEGPDNTIWVATLSSGLFVFDTNWKVVKQYKNSTESPQPFIPGDINVLFFDDKGQLWMGSTAQGLCMLHADRKTVTSFTIDNSALNNNYVRSVITLSKDSLLVGTFQGLNIVNTKTMQVIPVKMEHNGKGALNHNSVHCLLKDKDHTLWVGTYSGGINYSSPYHKQVSFIETKEFSGITGNGCEDNDGNIWFATEGAGLLCYNPFTEEQSLYPVKQPYGLHFETNIIKSLLIQGDTIYCGTHFGSVYLFSIKSKQYKLLYDFKSGDVYSLCLDHKKRLWIPTHSNSRLVMVENGHYTNQFVIDNKPQVFESVSMLKEIRPDVFILGTLENGFYLYDRNQHTAVHYAAKELGLGMHDKVGSVTGILTDPQKNIWITTSKSGVYRFDKEINLQKHYYKDDGISASYISSLLLDKEQNLWVITGNELYRHDQETDKFTHVKFDNLPALEYTLFAGNVSKEGVIYLSGNKGILSFNPGKKLINTNRPEVFISSVHINNKADTTDVTKGEPPLYFENGRRIVLKSNQTNIVIQYTSPGFIHPQLTRYAYKLDGVDDDWVVVDNRREAFYSNLSPGKYTFRVKAGNNDGFWNAEETILRITVDPPLWKTWWACLIYIGILSAISWKFISFRWTRLKLENNLRFKQMEKERMEELHSERIRMFTNFSHELRTPLTLIINPLDDLLKYVAFSTEVKSGLQLIKKNTGRLILLVNNLMDIQKYEAGKMVLQKSRFDFSEFIHEIYEAFESVTANRSINLELHLDIPSCYYVNYDRDEMEKVFFNLLSNAIKFTPSGGTVTIRVKRLTNRDSLLLPLLKDEQRNALIEESYLYIEVTDTGKGIDSKIADKIFEPFYRSADDLHKQIAGTGIGLSLTRSIVLRHNGCIWTESAIDSGTRMMLLLPDTEKQQIHPQETIFALDVQETTKKVALLMEEAESRTKPTLLIADDNREVLEYLEQQLQTEYIIWKANNGREALALIENSFPDMLVSDVMMPEMNGLELCRRVKGNVNFCHIPVILLTAKSMVSQIEEGWEAGADDYIVKPFHVSLLNARIRNILSSRAQMKTVYGDKLSLKSLGVELPAEDDSFLSRYIEIVKANISNPDFDVSVIYQSIGMSRANFYRKVKAVTGLSPIELIKNIRMEAGARLLEETTMPVSEIFRQVGFSSSSYFAKNFKAVYGMSPTEYQTQKHNN